MNRIEQLDSIRGLASLSVVFNHLYLTFPVFTLLLWQSPARMLVNGKGAVILFFVLSGFVLSLPFLSGKKIGYPAYLVKRIFRIYVPYLLAITLAILASGWAGGQAVSGLSDWFNAFWASGFSLQYLGEHLLLLGNIHSDAYNTVIWSLVHEMRISLVFPVIMLLVLRFHAAGNLLLILGLSLAGGLNDVFGLSVSNGFHTTYFDSIQYAAMFVAGALLAKHRRELMRLYVKLGRVVKGLLLLAALFFYNYGSAVDKVFDMPFARVAAELCIAGGACIFILFGIASARLSGLLTLKPVLFLGQISYSLYLYHFTILLIGFHVLYPVTNIWITELAVLAASIIVAALAYRYVELPCIRVGAKVSAWVRELPVFMPKRSGRESSV